MSLPDLLFVTPVLPSPAGSGTMLRAAVSLEALSKRFQVHVLNFNLWTTNFGRPSFAHSRAASYTEVPGRRKDIDGAALLDHLFPAVQFAAIHTFRLAMARVSVGMLARTKARQPYLVLDLDDNECDLSTRLVNLLERDNDLEAAKYVRAEQPQMRILEKMLAPRFQALCLANPDDCRVFAARYPGVAVHHLPNVVRLPEDLGVEAVSQSRSARLLFVGALNYPPNIDGICFFCEQVLPLIEVRAGTPVSLRVVGSDPKPRVSLLNRNPAVTIHGNVPSVDPYYRDADVCIVPVRAGSGTRIKILEAFSFRRPVVSTRLGAEGLGVIDGEHLLLADEPEEIARKCLTLLNDRESRDRMVESAYRWVLENHSLPRMQAAVDSIYRPVLAQLSEERAGGNVSS